jgi:ABC-type metal ion transport system substrate-binding protein
MKKIMIKLKKPMRQSKKTMEGIEENQGKLKKTWETV